MDNKSRKFLMEILGKHTEAITRHDAVIMSPKTDSEEIESIFDEYGIAKVIRCKECKYFHTEECSMDDFHFADTGENDFCSFGEREN